MGKTIARERVLSLQTLRAFACVLVILSHCSFAAWTSNVWGGLGVSIFVILSGFVITMGYDADDVRQDIRCISNVKKRLIQIVPLHYALFCSARIIGLIFGNRYDPVKIVLELTMLKAFVPIPEYYYSFIAVTWYLTLVLFFALVTPLLLKLIRLFAKYVTVIFFGVLIFRLLWMFIWRNHDNVLWLTYVSPFFRTTDYFLGMLLGTQINKISKLLRNRTLGILCGGVVFILLLYLYITLCCSPQWWHDLLRTPISVGLIICVYIADKFPGFINRRILQNRLTVWLGNVSFEMYLLHCYVMIVVEKILNIIGISNSILHAFLILLGTALAAQVWVMLTKQIKKIFQRKPRKITEKF